MKPMASVGVWVLGLFLATAALPQENTSRHIEELGRAGFLSGASGSGPEMTAVAGARFLDLVPESRREVCRILLEHLAKRHQGLFRLRIVDQQGGPVSACEL